MAGVKARFLFFDEISSEISEEAYDVMGKEEEERRKLPNKEENMMRRPRVSVP